MNITVWLFYHGKPNDSKLIFWFLRRGRSPSQHFSVFSIGSPTPIPPFAHTREIRKLISFLWDSICRDSGCKSSNDLDIPTHRSRFTLRWKCFYHLSKLYACNLSHWIFWTTDYNNFLLCKNFGNHVLFRKENEGGFQDIWKRKVAENFVLEALLRLEFSKSAKRTSPVLTRKQDKKRQRIRSLKDTIAISKFVHEIEW